jgi:uncharacterized protein YjiS (DUF1127 family)
MEMAMTESDETNSDEIELLTLDDRKLTPQQWEHFKRRAQDARTQAMRDLSRGVLSSLRDAAAGGWDVIRACGHWGAEAASKGWRAYAARRVRRRAIRELNALDDRSLKDIGVNRSEILSVIYGREWTRTTERTNRAGPLSASNKTEHEPLAQRSDQATRPASDQAERRLMAEHQAPRSRMFFAIGVAYPTVSSNVVRNGCAG